MLPDPDARRRNLRALFRELLAEARARGATIDVTDDGEAAALWYPPDLAPSFEAPPRSGAEVVGALAAIGAARPRGRHWYLAFLGARPGGGGHGTVLLAHRLGALDGEGVASALWTGAERNLVFYGRAGYRVRERLEFAGAGAWWLWRDPA